MKVRAAVVSAVALVLAATPAFAGTTGVVDTYDWPADNPWSTENNRPTGLRLQETGFVSQVAALENFAFSFGDAAHYYRGAPSGSYIYRAEFSGITHAPNQSQEYGGIYRDDIGSWEAGQWEDRASSNGALLGSGTTANRYQSTAENGVDSAYCARPNCAIGGTVGNRAIWGMRMLGQTLNTSEAVVGAGSARLYYSDDHVPTVAVVSHSGYTPGTWAENPSATTSLRGEVTAGLGMGRVGVQRTGQATQWGPAACTWVRDSTCSGTTTNSLSYGSTYPEGSNVVTGRAENIAGNQSTSNPAWRVNVDRTPPQATITGDGWSGVVNGVVLPGERSVTIAASDGSDAADSTARSGVKSIDVRIDDESLADFPASQPCNSPPRHSCSMTRTATYDTNDYPDGEHTITVVVRDQLDHPQTYITQARFGSPIAPPDTCDDITVSDGYVGPANYLALKAEQSQTNVTTVCWHVASLPLLNQAGSVTFIGASLDGGLPAIDPGEGASCVDAGGSAVVDNENPTLGNVRISYVTSGSPGPSEAWVCVEAPGVNYRLRLTVPIVGEPEVELGVANPAPLPPAPAAWPDKASKRCNQTSGTFLVNTELAGRHVWLATDSAGGTVEVCVREEPAAGGAGNGAVITVSPASVGQPVGVSDDLTPCNEVVNHLNSPTKLWIDRSTSTEPLSVCIDTDFVDTRIFVGTSGVGSPVSYELDEG